MRCYLSCRSLRLYFRLYLCAERERENEREKRERNREEIRVLQAGGTDFARCFQKSCSLLARILINEKLCIQVSGFAPMEMGAATARKKPGTRYFLQQDIMVKLARTSQPFEALETKKGDKTTCR